MLLEPVRGQENLAKIDKQLEAQCRQVEIYTQAYHIQTAEVKDQETILKEARGEKKTLLTEERE